MLKHTCMRNKSFNELQQEVVDEIINEMNAQDALSYGIEPINEMAPPAYGNYRRRTPVSVHYIGRDNHETDYFKLVRGTSFKSSTVVCRISLRGAFYSDHGNNEGKEQFYPDPAEKESMIRALAAPCTRSGYGDMTALQAMLKDANKHLSDHGYETIPEGSITPETYKDLPIYANRKRK